MTPAARLSAAITVLDAILQGQGAEAALTHWGRASRYAGSGDRHAVRDLVFTALRARASFAALGGGMTGRGLILGGLRAGGADVAALFSGQGHAPAPLTAADAPRSPDAAEAMDLPAWLLPELQAQFGAALPDFAAAQRARAPVFLRANPARARLCKTMAALADQGVIVQEIQGLHFGLQVIAGEKKIQTSAAYREGWVELQDRASQGVIAALGLPGGLGPGAKVLDFCAGGGGKILNIAAYLHDRKDISLIAHDAAPARMADLPARAARAGAQVKIVTQLSEKDRFDLIIADVPCSGAGSWRRDPQGKWRLTPDRLAALQDTQAQILDRTARALAPQGRLAYCTCSVLPSEDEGQIAAFLARTPGFRCTQMQRFGLAAGDFGPGCGDGFFLAVLQRG